MVETHARLFLKSLYGYKRQGRFQLHAFVVMPEHVHLLLTPTVDITLERAMQFIKGGYSHTAALSLGARVRFGRGDSPTTAFAMLKILRVIVITFIKTRLSGDSL